MAEFMTGLKRTHYCGDLRISDVDKEVTVCGWVQRCRDLGQLIFIDLRDRTGVVQLAFNDKTDKEIFDKAFACRSEFVLAAKGKVLERSSKNSDIPTGDIEVLVTDLRVLSKAQTPPFEIVDNTETNEELRLKYRYLDLRRRPLLNNLMTRSKIAKTARDYFAENGFVEIETPMMIKSTPEGARDYLVPSRVHNGKFYALPQSPQIYKQLLMVSGFDRYIQLARCFRDEDLRADRQPEFTQIDMELSFVDVEDILEINEGLFKRIFKDVLNKDLKTPFERMTYKEAMENYGSDKPDIRFDMKIQDISDLVKDCGFGVFTGAIENGGSVRAIVAKNAASVYTRKEIDKLTEYAKGIGAKGLAYVRWVDEPNASFKKFMTEEELNAVYERLQAEKGDVILIVADKDSTVFSTLGALRLKIAKRLDIIPNEFKFLWIVDFPFFEYDEESGEWLAMHHPFTMPKEECLQYLDTDPSKVTAKAFDLTLNGIELSSGSMRITDPELQQKMFKALKLTDEEIEAKFGFLVEAYKYGAPPHGGMGIGLDRVSMLLCGADSLRDVTAFPKVQNASELMSSCPAPVDKESLDVLGIAITKTEEE
ncbi:aspartate--tRNA ligase [Ruminococcus sp. YE282]|jgi:aspartyl-tRNA synthetase|uniref:aspartate--tRNA ligase n=1 Tax=Ruminococcus sp. YE282 TaxID=3158780 RepID=UPI00088A739C|nr:aspartate--tRNA ligase [Ruminococcus bromii]MEE3497848.1 aspartate--tRNA ligase [Ruminococcus bromii]SCY62562.1 aspartyl-tRNA synthetase [Ruminococcus bromii]